MALYDFVKSLTKSSLLAHLKNIDQKTMKWRKDLLDAVVTKDELEEWSSGGGVDHGALTGLTDDDHTQYLLANGTRALSAAWDAGNFEIRSSTFESDVATGTAPLTIASTTKVANLNADLLDDQTGSYYLDHGNHTGLADDDHPQYPKKRGWDADYSSSVTLSFDAGTRTFSIAPTGANFEYWVAGIKYTKTTTQSVIIDDTEGIWFIYFDGATLTASQTPWDMVNDDIALVATVYWDATNNALIRSEYELHSWVMDPSSHGYLHDVFGTRWEDGLAVSINGANLDVTNGHIHDEDIDIYITDDVGSGTWDQTLTPASLPIIYRTGADGDWRIIAASTTPVYLDTNVPQINTYSGGAWGWEAAGVAGYFVYWVIASGDITDPVWLVPGQESSATLNAARDGNQLSNMLFGDLPTMEHKVLARVIIQRTAGSPYYSLTEVNDYRQAVDEPSSSAPVVGDHGALTGLSDDDHTQYLLASGARAITGGESLKWGVSPSGSHDVIRYSEGVLSIGEDATYIGSIAPLNEEVYLRGIGNTGAATYDLIGAVSTNVKVGDTDAVLNLVAGGGGISVNQFISSSLAIGTAPFQPTSTTVCTNLNADLLDGEHAAAFATSAHTHSDYINKDGTVALTANWDAGSFEVRAETFESDVATGTAPFTIASTTVSTNLNADLLDGDHTSEFFHNNVANEIASLSQKATPAGPDFLIIEDSEDANSKKYINISDLPFGSTTGSGVTTDIYFEDPPYTSGNNLTVEGEWTNVTPYTQYWTSSLQTPPGGSGEGCAQKNATSSSGARARYDTTQWTSGVVDCYYRIHANVNQNCAVFFGDAAMSNGVYFGLVTASGGDTTGFQYNSAGTPETYHTHFGTTNGTTAYWIRAYIDMDSGLGKMKGWSGNVGDEPAPWGVERTFTGATPNPLYMILHAGTTSNSSSFANIWEIHVYNNYVSGGTLGDIDHGILDGLADDDHTQYLLASGTRALTANWDAGAFEIRAETFESDVATGTIPLVIASTTACTNLNADLLDGVHAASLLSSTLDTGAISMTVKNSTGVNIPIRSLCYISGDSSGTPLITLADADAEASCSKMLVMTAAQINNGASGLAIIYGWVTGLTGLTAGAIQYASTTDGGITETAPAGSGDIVRIVGYAMSTTEIFFNPSAHYTVLP